MSYIDPRGRDPQFPDRPTHQDHIDLSEVAQGNDVRAEAGTQIPEIVGLDMNSVMYFIRQRFGILSQANGMRIDPDSPLLMGLYLDALAVGKGLAEHRAPSLRPLPRNDAGDLITSAEYGETLMVRIQWNTDADGRQIDPGEAHPETFHGDFTSFEEAASWMDAHPDDTDVHDMVVVTLNRVRPA